MEDRGSAYDVDQDSSRDGIQEHDLAEEFSSDWPSMAMSTSAPSGTSPYASLLLLTASAVKADDRDIAHGAGRVGDTKNLEHALPSGPMQLPGGFGMVDSMERPPVVLASNYDVSPGAHPVRSARNTATTRALRSAMSSYDPPREFVYEESKQEDGLPSSAATGSGLYAVEAQRVPDGNDDETVMVAEVQHLKLKWYQRRWITMGSILFACGLAVVVVVLVVRQPPSGASSSSLTSPTQVPMFGAPATTPDPTMAPPIMATITGTPTTLVLALTPPTFTPTTVLTPVAIACNFLSITNVTVCRSTLAFESCCGDTTTGSTIPSEIGLLTQLTILDLDSNSLTSTIPSEIGLLTKLRLLRFDHNALTSTIPSEIGLLTQLTYLDFWSNTLKGIIPASLCSLSSLSSIYIKCGEIACDPGCCFDYSTGTSCGSLTPFGIACNFLSIPNVTKCRSTFVFDSANNENDRTTSSTIPSEVGLLTHLTYLDFSDNALTSSIPSEIGLLTKLTVLEFGGNDLTSSIPSEIGLLTLLDALSFLFNEFTSAIPSEIGRLTLLTYLRFDVNSLTSTIPSEIGRLTQMDQLDFAMNQLTSTIPSEIGRLTQLRNLAFDENLLTGSIPSSLCSVPILYGYIHIDLTEVTCAPGCCYPC